MINNTELANLHDAVLAGISFDWGCGEVSISLRLVPDGGAAQIVCQQLTLLTVARRFPWGQNVRVNSAALCPIASAAPTVRLSLEMASGDEIIVEAADVAPSVTSSFGSEVSTNSGQAHLSNYWHLAFI